MKATQALGGFVKKRVVEIGKVAKRAQCMQPPSLYVSASTPLEVWAIPNPSGSAPQTIFFELPQVQECDSIIELPKHVFDAQEAFTMMKADLKWFTCWRKQG
jgi:hypothetical protein